VETGCIELNSNFEGGTKNGGRSIMTIPPNVKYKDRFLKAYQEAREGKVGLWGE